MDNAQKEKAAALERAVVNCSVEELSKVYDELGYVEMSAPALGLACRFRGMELVKALIKKGASFDFPSKRRIEETYNCYIGRHSGNYRTNYSLYLLKVFGEDLKGAFCFKGMTMSQSAERETGELLEFLSDDRRIDVLKCLLENREKISFHPEEMLFYAIYFGDTVIMEELKRCGVHLSEIRVRTITDGAAAMNAYWFEYVTMTGQLTDEEYFSVMQQLAAEFGGKQFHFTENLYETMKKRLYDVKVFEFFLARFKQEKVKKYQIIRGLIELDAAEVLPVIERENWLTTPKKRDEMIAYASENGKTESLAWLLDFKNRTADFAVEQEKAEKRMMRELNAAPDSVAVLRKIWSYKKREDGTLKITNYKGTDTEVVVPEKIGKSTVTAIEIAAFSGNAVCVGDFYSIAGLEHLKRHEKITKLTLPRTIQSVGSYAFYDMFALEEINIPEGVEKIEDFTFWRCRSLKNITIPGTIKIIGKSAFAGCVNLEKVYICEGVLEIGESAFANCDLKEIQIPGSVQNLVVNTDGSDTCRVFGYSHYPKMKVYCPEGSSAETYCKKKRLRVENTATAAGCCNAGAETDATE